MLTNDTTQKVGMKVLNLARAALDDAGHTVSAPGESEPGEFYVEIDGVDVAVKVEVL
jgi:hypothetical protein